MLTVFHVWAATAMCCAIVVWCLFTSKAKKERNQNQEETKVHTTMPRFQIKTVTMPN